MKKKLTIENLRMVLVTLLFMMFSVSGFSQACPGSQATLRIGNVVQTPTTLEYDLFVKNSGTVSMKLSALAGNVRFPAGMLTTGTLTVIEQPSTLTPFTGFPNLSPNLTVASQQARWTNTPPLSEPNSINLAQGTEYRFARFRITNTGTAWVTNYATQLAFATGGTGITLNIVTVYCGGNTNSTPMSLANSNLILVNAADVCFTSGTYTAVPASCTTIADGAATFTMSPIPSNLNATVSIDSGAPTAITMTASGQITSSGYLPGNHTITVTGSGSCTTPVTIPFVITGPSPVTPTFTQVPAICNGGTLSALPTTSNNGVTGTWAPALDNTTTTTYTFTPDAGQCATTATMTITVNPNVTPTFTQVAAICSGSTLAPLPLVSNNSISGTWAPALSNTATGTYTFTPDAGQCATTATMTITVVPNTNTTVTLTECSSYTWPVNGTTYTTSGIYVAPVVLTSGIFNTLASWNANATANSATVSTNTMAGLTATAGAVNTTVGSTAVNITAPGTIYTAPTFVGTNLPNEALTMTFTPPAYGVSGNYYVTNVSDVAIAGTLTVTYSDGTVDTQAVSADTAFFGYFKNTVGISSIVITPVATTPAVNRYVSIKNLNVAVAPLCQTQTLDLTITPGGTTPTFTQVAAICSGATLAALPTTSNNGITGTWSPALNNTATTTYTFTPNVGQCATTATMTITVNPNTNTTTTITACNTYTWAVNGTTYTTSGVYVIPVVLTNGIFNTLASWNANATANNAVVSLNTMAGLTATGGAVNTTVGPTAVNITAPGTIYTAPTFIGTNLPNEALTMTFNPPAYGISGNYYVTNISDVAIAGTLTVTYSDGTVDTQAVSADTDFFGYFKNTGISSIVITPVATTPAVNRYVSIKNLRVAVASQCQTQTLDLTITPLANPTFTQVAAICSGATLAALPTTSNNGITGTWAPALDNTTTTTYTFTPTAGQCANTATMTITVTPTTNTTTTIAACDTYTWAVNGTTYTTSGIYVVPVVLTNGIFNTLASWNANATANSATVSTNTMAGLTATAGAINTTVGSTAVNITAPGTIYTAPTFVGTNLPNEALTMTFTPPAYGVSGNYYVTNVSDVAIAGTLTVTYSDGTVDTQAVSADTAFFGYFKNTVGISSIVITPVATTPAVNRYVSIKNLNVAVAPLCQTQTLDLTITPTVTPTFTQVAPICSGATLTALPTTSDNGVTGTWSPALNNTTTTTYTFTPTVGQCANTATMTITVNPVPTSTITGGDVTVCQGSTVTLSAPAGADSYVWVKRYIAAGPIVEILGSASTQAVTTSGIYSVTVTTGGCSSTSSTNVNVADYVFSGTIAAGDATQTGRLNRFATISTCAAPKGCPGTFTTTGSRAYDSYTITNPSATAVCATIGITTTCGNNVFCVAYDGSYNPTTLCTNYLGDPGSSATAIYYQVTVPANGTIVVVVHEVNTGAGCTGYNLTVDMPRTPAAIVASNPTPNCGDAVTLTASTANSYLWSPGGATTSSINVTAGAAATYTVTLGYGNNSCTATASTTVTGALVIPTFTQVAPICSGATLAALPTTSNNGIAGTWAPALNNTATTTYTFTPTVSGPCTGTATMTIVVNPLPLATFTANPFPVCAGSSTQLTATVNNITPTVAFGSSSASMSVAAFGTPLTSSLAGMIVDAGSNGCAAFAPGTFTGKIALIQRGTCSFAIKAQNAQDAGAVAVLIYNNVAGALAIGGTAPTVTIPVYGLSLADGQAIIAAMTAGQVAGTLTPAPVFTYLWGNGGTTQTINTGVLNANTVFTVAITNPATGCTNNLSVNVPVTPLVTPTFTQVAAICTGGSFTLPTTSDNAITGTWSPAIDNTATTTYTFTPTAGQCATTATMTVTVNPLTTNGSVTTTACGSYTWAENGTTYTTSQSNVTVVTGCNTATLNLTINPLAATPTGSSTQSFSVATLNDATIASLVVSPTSVIWYPTLADAQAGTNALASTTVLTNGSTYYAVNPGTPCPSLPFAVTVTVTLGNDDFDSVSFDYYPNPTSSILNISYSKVITQIQVTNMLGQTIMTKKTNDTAVQVDLSSLAEATYFVKVSSEGKEKVIKIIKRG